MSVLTINAMMSMSLGRSEPVVCMHEILTGPVLVALAAMHVRPGSYETVTLKPQCAPGRGGSPPAAARRHSMLAKSQSNPDQARPP